MRKLLLTSAGLSTQRIKEEFLRLFNKPFSEIKVIFVPTASQTEHELKHVAESKEELVNLGISLLNIKTLELKENVSYLDVKGFDLIYVCGGNTFYLLERVRKTGFDKIIIEFLKNSGVYLGVSAGSLIPGPSIESAGWGKFPDDNSINLQDLSGLKILDFEVYPHYEPSCKQEVEEFRKKVSYEILPLTNEQALLIKGRKKILID